MSDQIILTREGYQKLKQELEYLKTEGRAQSAERIRRARAQGDLSENFEYHEAKRAQAMLEGRIRELQRILEIAQVVEHLPGEEDGAVIIGSVVTVQDLEHGEEWTFRVVDTASAAVFGSDEEVEHVSAASPIGQAVVGKKVGDIVQVQTPDGTVDYEILAVHT
ncbi:MAG: transcription elongation factor GreA [bacterium]|nr:transcription elongation factor GreA [bacterium]MCS7310132.1 transcription elongation factor GreA [Armatimonadota bacterium]MDW8104004.1 transcription elongation factor GreA [Armatimonadota bacterium]